MPDRDPVCPGSAGLSPACSLVPKDAQRRRDAAAPRVGSCSGCRERRSHVAPAPLFLEKKQKKYLTDLDITRIPSFRGGRLSRKRVGSLACDVWLIQAGSHSAENAGRVLRSFQVRKCAKKVFSDLILSIVY